MNVILEKKLFHFGSNDDYDDEVIDRNGWHFREENQFDFDKLPE